MLVWFCAQEPFRWSVPLPLDAAWPDFSALAPLAQISASEMPRRLRQATRPLATLVLFLICPGSVGAQFDLWFAHCKLALIVLVSGETSSQRSHRPTSRFLDHLILWLRMNISPSDSLMLADFPFPMWLGFS